MFGQERSEASQHGPKMMVMMMMMGGGEDNVVIDGDINHWMDGMEEAAGGPGPGSVTQLRVRCPGTEHTLAEEEEESGIRIQTQAREYRTICLTSNKVAHKRRSGQDLSLSSVSGWQRKKRSQDGARPDPGPGMRDGTICLTHCHRPAQSSHTREVVARLATSVGCA